MEWGAWSESVWDDCHSEPSLRRISDSLTLKIESTRDFSTRHRILRLSFTCSESAQDGDAPLRMTNPARSTLSALRRLADALLFIELDQVAFFEVVKALQTDAALVTFGNFFYVVGETFERAQLTLEDFGAATNHLSGSAA